MGYSFQKNSTPVLYGGNVAFATLIMMLFKQIKGVFITQYFIELGGDICFTIIVLQEETI